MGATDPSSGGFELRAGREGLPRLWGRRGFWQVKLRWAVAPLMIFGVVVAKALGFEFRATPILLIAIASPLYNGAFAWAFGRQKGKAEPALDRLLTQLEVLADYALMFLLIYFTGGTSSPLVVFFLFHVIIGGIQFRPPTAYQFAALAAAGLWALFLAESAGWLPNEPVTFRGQPVHVLDRPIYGASFLLVFTATLFITAAMVTAIMRRFRARVGDLAEATAELARLNEQLNSLYAMLTAVGAERRLEPILNTVTSELAAVMAVDGVAVKLLSEDGETLRYVGTFGLPEALGSETVLRVDQSPLSRRALEGETLVHGRVGKGDTFQLQEELSRLGIQSAVLAPLTIQERVIGTLSLYSRQADHFVEGDADFIRLAAELVAIAIEDAQANEAIETLVEDRTQFMLEMAHNLRAPLSASLSLLELLKDGELAGPEQQAEYVGRIEARLRSLHQTIGEVLTIARARDWSREIPDVVVSLSDLARYTEQTFGEAAAQKGLRFQVVAPEDLPSVDSGADLLQQVMDNLVSNAIKYTPAGGQVEVSFARTGPNEIQIMVEDSGIGIPPEEQRKLFGEFFRASNAKKLTSDGTGLGLALVNQTVERHRGRIHLASEEGQGTTVVVYLPIRQADLVTT